MEWMSKFHGKTVGIDTAPLIFYIEEDPKYLAVLDLFFADLAQGRFSVVTSTVTLLEVFIHPLRKDDFALAQQYNDILLSSAHISTLAVTVSIAQRAAELRAHHNLKTPDAIQLATALNHGAAMFLTNDRDFPTLSGLEILRVSDLVSSPER